VKRLILFIGLLTICLISIIACEKTENQNVAILRGNVYYLEDQGLVLPVEGALVVARNYYAQDITVADGSYELSIEIEEEEVEVEVEASKVGFNLSSQFVYLKKCEESIVPDITLNKSTADTTTLPGDSTYVDTTLSGPGAHVEIHGGHTSHVYVQSSGLKETAQVVFVVTDRQGRPVDGVNEVDLNFEIIEGPDGGEYVYPASMKTQSGFAYTVLSSGTISGAVRIRAWFEVNQTRYESTPMRLVIYGGLPEEEHFNVVVDQVNIAGHVHVGIIDKITAFVGDKYSNPVAPGTMVYFYTDYGIVDGGAATDVMGRASVDYMSTEPNPPFPPFGEPFAWIKATTYGDLEQNNTIVDSTRLLWSGQTGFIDIVPDTFSYTELNNPVQFSYKVKDIWGYPLVKNTNINVEATDGTLYGDVSIRMIDTQSSGPGTTDFQFSWAPGDSLDAPQVNISVKVSPPDLGNGYRSYFISGIKRW